MKLELEEEKEEKSSGWGKEFTHVGFHWVRETGEPAEDAAIIDHHGGERAYIVGARTNCYHEFTQGRYEFLAITPSDTEELFKLREEVKRLRAAVDEFCAEEGDDQDGRVQAMMTFHGK